jgi:hypothetical protein
MSADGVRPLYAVLVVRAHDGDAELESLTPAKVISPATTSQPWA